MFFHLFTPLSDGGDVFNLFRYITFRAGGAFMTALIFAFIFGRPIIEWLRRIQKKGQPIRDDGPERHIIEKAGTPTMGGVMILSALLISTLLWARLDNGFVWIVVLVTAGFGAIGFADDFMKVRAFSVKGVPGKVRLLLGFAIALGAAIWATSLQPEPLQNAIALPVLKNTLIHAGLFYAPFAMIVIVGSANAVNLTDGLDGLAIMPVMIAAGSLCASSAYVVGADRFHRVSAGSTTSPAQGEIAIICSAIIGAGLGFPLVQRPACDGVHGRHGIAWRLGGALGRNGGGGSKHEIVLAGHRWACSCSRRSA